MRGGAVDSSPVREVVSSSLAPATSERRSARIAFLVLYHFLKRSMHYFYVLYSLKDHNLYKGTCGDLAERFLRHNTGGNKSTAHRRPFVLIHAEIFESKKEALAREREAKTLEGGAALREKLVAFQVLTSKGELNS